MNPIRSRTLFFLLIQFLVFKLLAVQQTNFLEEILVSDSEWISDNQKSNTCQNGQIIKLSEPENSYLLGTRLSFFNVNSGEIKTTELKYPNCEVVDITTYENNILDHQRFKVCKNVKTKIDWKKINFLSNKIFNYESNFEKCNFKVKK